MTETVGWLIRVHWHVQHVSGVVGGEDVGDRTGQGAPTGCVWEGVESYTQGVCTNTHSGSSADTDRAFFFLTTPPPDSLPPVRLRPSTTHTHTHTYNADHEYAMFTLLLVQCVMYGSSNDTSTLVTKGVVRTVL